MNDPAVITLDTVPEVTCFGNARLDAGAVFKRHLELTLEGIESIGAADVNDEAVAVISISAIEASLCVGYPIQSCARSESACIVVAVAG